LTRWRFASTARFWIRHLRCVPCDLRRRSPASVVLVWALQPRRWLIGVDRSCAGRRTVLPDVVTRRVVVLLVLEVHCCPRKLLLKRLRTDDRSDCQLLHHSRAQTAGCSGPSGCLHLALKVSLKGRPLLRPSGWAKSGTVSWRIQRKPAVWRLRWIERWTERRLFPI